MLTAEPSPSGPIPWRVLFSDPDRVAPVLAPDGALLAYAALHEGALNVWVQDLDGADTSGPARPVTTSHHGVAEFTVCTGRRVVFTEDAGAGQSWRVSVLDLDTDISRLVVPGGQVHILSYNPCKPDRVLLTLRRDARSPHDVWELDLVTGQIAEVASNPGHTDGPLVRRWLVDPAQHVIGGVSAAPDGGTVIHLRTGPDACGPYEPLLCIPGEDLDPSAALQVAWDEALYTTTSLGVSTLRLVRIDPVTGDLTVVSGDPVADVVDVWWDPVSARPVVAVYGPGQPVLRVLDPAWTADVEALRELTGATAGLRLVSADSIGALLLIEATAPDAPAHYFLYSTKDRQGRRLFCDRPALAGYRLAPTTAVSLTGAGPELRCHLTRPVAAPDGPLPTVLQIRNGHPSRGHWRYDPETQWLASLGYAVITAHTPAQPPGHDAFDALADLAHGLVDHLAATSVIDPDRIGLYGGSDGGYAAVCGAASGEVFRCAVSGIDAADLTAMRTTMRTTRSSGEQFDADWARRTAQLADADRTTERMLMAEGIHLPDALVQLDALAADLTRDGVTHRVIDLNGEGRILVLRHTLATLITAAERVFTAYLGGTREPATATAPARPLQE